ncbi:SDR family oxidoreductase [Pelagibacterium lacus]|uniref:SDR family oxidoreductase n=1 Tax=Pelagibacterium lacus TaxID=2282655 RepID=UPI0018F27E82|nr:SDR family oxidoreductase [Pelagibacterium lacus]
MDPLTLFVFGAGYSARAAIRALGPDARVAATTRTPETAAALQASGIAAHLFEGTAPGVTLAADLRAATHVLISIAPDAAGDRVLAHHAADILAAPHLAWIGYFSTIGVYGDAGGAWIDETAPTEPLSARNRYRLDAEAAWRDLAAQKSVPLAILRLAGIYGPGRSPFDKLAAGTARRVNKPGQVFNRIHVDDIGAITAHAARARLDWVFNIADDAPAPPQEVIAHAAALMGMAPPPEIAFAEADLSPMARSFYAGNRRVSNARIKAALGYRLLYPTYREGHAALLTQRHD